MIDAVVLPLIARCADRVVREARARRSPKPNRIHTDRYMITFLALGAAIGSISPSVRAANIIIWVIFLPMLMLSELFLPISVLPDWLQPIAQALPLTALTTLLRDIVYGVRVINLWRLGILAAWTILALIVTIFLFRWE